MEAMLDSESEEEPFQDSGSEYNPSENEDSISSNSDDETGEDESSEEDNNTNNMQDFEAGGDNNFIPVLQWGPYQGK